MPERREQRQRLRGDTDADGRGGTATARPPSERRSEAATKGRKAVYILLTPLREWRVGTPRLPSVEDEPVLLQMQ